MSVLLRSSEFNTVSRELTGGVYVSRSATAFVQNDSVDLFTASGAVLIRALVGTVTTALAATASMTAKLQYTPSGGSAADLTGATGVTSDGVGTLYSLVTGVASNLLSVQTVGGSETPGVTFCQVLQTPIYVPAGTVSVLLSDHDPGSGAASWEILYTPFATSAAVTAA